MPIYTNDNGTSAFTQLTDIAGTVESPLIIADIDNIGSDAYARVLTVNSADNPAVRYATIVSGGTMTLTNDNVTPAASGGGQNKASAFDVTVSNGGYLNATNHNKVVSGGALMERITVESGGSLLTTNQNTLSDCVIKSGAQWVKNNETWIAGKNTTIEKGVVLHSGAVTGKAVTFLGTDFQILNGIVTGLDLHVDTYKSFYIRDLFIDGGTLRGNVSNWLHSGASARNMVVSNGAEMRLHSGTEVDTVRVEGVSGTQKARLLLSQGGINAYNVTVNSGGSVFAAPLKKTVAHVFISGLTINSSGSAYLGAGNSAYDVTINDGGRLFTSSAAAASSGSVISGATINAGGSLVLSRFHSAYDVKVAEGGYLNLDNDVFAENISAAAGATVRKTNVAIIAGMSTNIAKDVLIYNPGYANPLGENFQVVNGTATGLEVRSITNNGSVGRFYDLQIDGAQVLDGGSALFHSGVYASNVYASGSYVNANNATVKACVYAYNYASIDGLEIREGARMVLCAAYLKNAVVTEENSIETEDNTNVNVARIGGSNTTIVKGAVVSGAAFYGEDFQIDHGVVTGLVLSKNAIVSRANLFELDVNGAILSSGGTMHLSGGAHANNVGIRYGAVLVSNGATADNVNFDGYYVINNTNSAGTLYVSGGAVVSNVTNTKQAQKTFAVVNVYEGGTLDTFTNYANMTFQGDGTVDNLVMKGDAANWCSMTLAGTVTIDGGHTESTATLMTKIGTTLKNYEFRTGGHLYASNMVIEDCAFGGTLYQIRGAIVRNTTQTRGTLHMSANAGENPELHDYTMTGGTINMSAGAIDDFTMTGGTLNVSGGAITGAAFGAGAAVTLNAGGTIANAEINGENGRIGMTGGTLQSVRVVGDATAALANTNARIVIVTAGTGAEIYGASVKDHAFFSFSAGTAYDLTVDRLGRLTMSNGVTVTGLTMDEDSLFVNNKGGTISDITQYGGELYLNDETGAPGAANTLVVTGGRVYVQKGGTLNGATISDDAEVRVSSGGALSVATLTGGTLVATTEASISDVTASGSDTEIRFDFSKEGNIAAAIFNTFANIGDEVDISVTGLAAGNTYSLAAAGSTDAIEIEAGLYFTDLAAGDSYTNAATGMTYTFNADGRTVTTTAFTVQAATAAAALTAADRDLNGADRAAKWIDTTSCTTAVDLVDTSVYDLAGDAWLTIDGANVESALYGVKGVFNHAVNIAAKSGTIRNLAAGAEVGGSVAGVNLTLEGANVTGAAYAGGFGAVSGDVNTRIAGGEFAKDFYAGALYRKSNGSYTTVQDIAFSVEGGTFKGNIYGASAVKADSTVGSGARHRVNDVIMVLANGAAAKYGFCAFAGGYATGDTADTVYTVSSVTLEVAGGNWGTAAGGRGIFGGILAAGVAATAGDVTIAVTGGTMGNVFGGGWAQQGGSSTVGNVDIAITGGTIANVFGGGSHSVTVPGGTTTVAGDVNILIQGGDVTNAIYAMGQSDGDAVTGSATVIFEGDKSYTCSVYGYGFVGSTTPTASKLVFSDYFGTLSGDIGGFSSGIEVFGDTTAIFTGAIEEDITKWSFDLTDRGDDYSGKSLVNLAAFEDDAVIDVTFADAAQAQGGWNLATVTGGAVANTTQFNLALADSTVIANDLVFGAQISGGDYDGWGLALENNVLKFKNLA